MKKIFSLVVMSFLIVTFLGLFTGCGTASKAVSPFPEELRSPGLHGQKDISKLVVGSWGGYYYNIRVSLASKQKEYPAWAEIEGGYLTYSQEVGNVRYRVPLEFIENQFVFTIPGTDKRIVLIYNEATDELVGWRSDKSAGTSEGWRWHFERRVGAQKVSM